MLLSCATCPFLKDHIFHTNGDYLWYLTATTLALFGHLSIWLNFRYWLGIKEHIGGINIIHVAASKEHVLSFAYNFLNCHQVI